MASFREMSSGCHSAFYFVLSFILSLSWFEVTTLSPCMIMDTLFELRLPGASLICSPWFSASFVFLAPVRIGGNEYSIAVSYTTCLLVLAFTLPPLRYAGTITQKPSLSTLLAVFCIIC